MSTLVQAISQYGLVPSGPNQYLNYRWPTYKTYDAISHTKPQWVNSLVVSKNLVNNSSDNAICIYARLTHCGLVTPYGNKEPGLTLAQIMAFCPTAPSHYLIKCWLIVNWTLTSKLHWNLNQNTNFFFHKITFENVVYKMSAIFFLVSMCWRSAGMNVVLVCIYIY